MGEKINVFVSNNNTFKGNLNTALFFSAFQIKSSKLLSLVIINQPTRNFFVLIHRLSRLELQFEMRSFNSSTDFKTLTNIS